MSLPRTLQKAPPPPRPSVTIRMDGSTRLPDDPKAAEAARQAELLRLQQQQQILNQELAVEQARRDAAQFSRAPRTDQERRQQQEDVQRNPEYYTPTGRRATPPAGLTWDQWREQEAAPDGPLPSRQRQLELDRQRKERMREQFPDFFDASGRARRPPPGTTFEQWAESGQTPPAVLRQRAADQRAQLKRDKPWLFTDTGRERRPPGNMTPEQWRSQPSPVPWIDPAHRERVNREWKDQMKREHPEWFTSGGAFNPKRYREAQRDLELLQQLHGQTPDHDTYATHQRTMEDGQRRADQQHDNSPIAKPGTPEWDRRYAQRRAQAALDQQRREQQSRARPAYDPIDAIRRAAGAWWDRAKKTPIPPSIVPTVPPRR